MVDASQDTSNALRIRVELKAMSMTLEKDSTEIDSGSCSTEDDQPSHASVSESSASFVDSTEDVMTRPLAEVPDVQETAASKLGHPCSSSTTRTEIIDRSFASLRSMSTHEENHIKEPDAKQGFVAQKFVGAPQHSGYMDELETANFFDEYINPRSLWTYSREDSIEDEVESVDSGTEGPPSSRESAYDLGYAHDVRLPATYVLGSPSLSSFFSTHEPHKRRSPQDARGHLSSGDGFKGLQRKVGMRLSL
eukprot:TRINITY_DN27708_c0_g1_i2.p1 TRINITY_DN27708_c0_g1~~TRINITY_DN27708_c0_g1_i2.p1  ORF type:complete len:250 (-),score=31.30 TRINITY_DN27708_c0_g1_i2:148-897(-)